MKAKATFAIFLAAVFLFGHPVAAQTDLADAQATALASALGTAFTYQGRLLDGGVPRTGSYDLLFTLFDAATGGTPIGSPVTKTDVAVAAGLFVVELDFSASVFTGQALWLEIGARPGGSANPFTVLSPRQALTAEPYALFSAAPWATSGANVSYSAGNVGIGTSDPQVPLEVITTAQTGNAIEVTSLGGAPAVFGRRANGSAASPSGVQLGNTLAVFASRGYGASGYGFFTGYMDFQATEGWTDTAQGTRIRFFTPANGSNSPQQRMLIDHNGNVGVGDTQGPLSKLHIVADSEKAATSTSRALAVTTNDLSSPFALDVKMLGDPVLANRGVILQTTDWNTQDGGNILLEPQGGRVGIGTTSPSNTLSVNGSADFTNGNVGIGITNPVDARLVVQTPTGTNGFVITDGSVKLFSRLNPSNAEFGTLTDHDLVFTTGGFTSMQIDAAAGNMFPTCDGCSSLGKSTNRWAAVFAVNGTIQTSDARLKKGVADLDYGLSQVMQLRPVTFQWKDGSDARTHLGLIAQEVAEVIPEVVERSEDPAAPLGMSYTGLVPVLVKAVQEQQARLAHDDAEIKALRAENEALNARLTALEQAKR